MNESYQKFKFLESDICSIPDRSSYGYLTGEDVDVVCYTDESLIALTRAIFFARAWSCDHARKHMVR